MTTYESPRGTPVPLLLALLALLALPATRLDSGTALAGQSLRGSSHSLDVQNRMARQHDYSYLRTGDRVRQFVEAGYLVPVRSNDDFRLHRVSYPVARPEVELFVRRLASQYRAACGERLVVTSLTRPINRQPRNASSRSVHPTGMAVDLRLSRQRACRSWLEGVLLSLERAGVLEATRERYPAHYHVALFPRSYLAYVDRRTDGQVVLAEPASAITYEVRPGDTLWTLARRHDTSVEFLRSVNDLSGNQIYAGQMIRLPTSGR